MAVSYRDFSSFPRELRDHIYRYWWTDQWSVTIYNDSQIIPFEDPDREPACYAASGWRVNRKLVYPQTLVLNQQIHDELLASFLPGSHLVLAGFYFAIDEDMEPLDFEHLGVPLAVFENASEIDFRLELVPRYQFFKSHTVESHFETLRSVGINRYMGNTKHDQYAKGCNQYAKDKFGPRSVELRTPERAFSRFLEKLGPDGVAGRQEILEQAETGRPFDLREIGDYNRTLFVKGLDAGLISQSAVLERIEALRAVHNVGLPLPKRFYDFFEFEEAAAVLWEDFVLGIRPLVPALEYILDQATFLDRFRFMLRTREPLLSREAVLGNIINCLPDLTSLRCLESVSIASSTPLPFPDPRFTRIYEQWTCEEGVRKADGYPLEALFEEALAPFPLPPDVLIYRAESDGGLMQALETESEHISMDGRDVWTAFHMFFDWPELKSARRELREESEEGGGEEQREEGKQGEGVAQRLAEVIEQRDQGDKLRDGAPREESEDPRITTLRRLDAEAEENGWRNLRVFESFY